MPNYQLASDEDLLLLSRSGDALAQNELDVRYCKNHEYIIRNLASDLLRFRSICDLSAVAFQCYLRCLGCYEFGAASFHTFYQLCLGHELSRVRKDVYEERRCVFSIDEDTRSAEELTYHDVIPSSSIYDNPTKYVDYFEEIYALNLAPSSINPETLVVARLRLNGMEFKEIAHKLRISIRKVYYRYSVFEEEVKKLVEKEGYAKA